MNFSPELFDKSSNARGKCSLSRNLTMVSSKLTFRKKLQVLGNHFKVLMKKHTLKLRNTEMFYRFMFFCLARGDNEEVSKGVMVFGHK